MRILSSLERCLLRQTTLKQVAIFEFGVILALFCIFESATYSSVPPDINFFHYRKNPPYATNSLHRGASLIHKSVPTYHPLNSTILSL